jgi:MFS family permease
MTAATGGGMFIDGFVFATFAAAMAGRAHDELRVTALWESLISASVLVGTFFGGLFLGYVTDRIGRRPMFTIDLSVFLACAVLIYFVQESWQVFAIGLVMGLAVGADYSIGSPLLGEFAQARNRGNRLGLLEIMWNVGYVVAYMVGYAINTYEPGAWRFILAASAVPAIICLIMRHGLPESPRWLISKGRREEALAILRDQMEIADPGDVVEEEETGTRWGLLFSKDYLRRTVFACTFWSAIVMPYFALTFFQPTILRTLGLGDSALLGALLGTIIALVGATIGWYLVDRVLVPAGGGRRDLLLRVPVLVRDHVDPPGHLPRGDLPELGARFGCGCRDGGQSRRRRVGHVPAADRGSGTRHTRGTRDHGRGVDHRRCHVVLLGAGNQRHGAHRHLTPRRPAPLPPQGRQRTRVTHGTIPSPTSCAAVSSHSVKAARCLLFGRARMWSSTSWEASRR